MTPEERRKAHIGAVAGSVYAVNVSPVEGYYKLLAYFDEHEPAVADAIRYGLEAQHDEQCPYGATKPATECCSWRNSWEINYPPALDGPRNRGSIDT